MFMRKAKKTYERCLTLLLIVSMVCPMFSVLVNGQELAKEERVIENGNNEDYRTNLENVRQGTGTGTWEVKPDGLNGRGEGDNYILSDSWGKDFVYETEVTFQDDRGIASLTFRSTNDPENLNMYVANINREDGAARLFKWENNKPLDIVEIKHVEKKDYYILKIVAIGQHIVFYVDDILVGNTGDFIMSGPDLTGGQNDAHLEGYFGLLNFNSTVTYQNTYYTELDEANYPLLEDLQLEPTQGEAEYENPFKQYQYMYLQYVTNETEQTKIVAEPLHESTKINIKKGENGESQTDTVALDIGENLYTVTATNTIRNEDSGEDVDATLVYRYLIHRRKETHYQEEYRGQYHYSVKEGWANDPNGMVYFNGEWHLFYQFYNDTKWGPMHWAHAVSQDLIHWEEKPITFYPDEYGSMFSGCAVVDRGNTSGLFEGNQDGLVALITTHGNGQRVTLAYSADGENWEKTNKIAIDWREDDPLDDPAFRDPKVFRYQDKWFMVIAGGPLRIYSSDNLLDWKVESAYTDLHTECPDLYRLPYGEGNDKEYKWVLSRGGREYKIGDFREVDGNWKFVPDAAYEHTDGIMNFGKDSYAAMTYYINDFDDGYEAESGERRLIEINWMNNWDYCNLVDDASNNDTFNGTFNLQLELGLTKDDNGKFLLQQIPIEEYETLRKEDEVIAYNDVTIKPGENLLKDFQCDSYEIIANFKPESSVTEVGFEVRSGENDRTPILYDVNKKEFILDRTQSGAYVNDKFSESYRQSVVNENADGSISMHIFVDRASLEMFSGDYTLAGAVQIFPDSRSNGLEVVSRGGNTQADIEIYPMESIWPEYENNLDTNLEDWDLSSKQWYVDDQYLFGNSHGANNIFYFTNTKNTSSSYEYHVDVMKESGIVNMIFAASGKDPKQGCYSFQMRDDAIRLFDFGDDHTFEEKAFSMEKGKEYEVQVKVTCVEESNEIEVYINDELCMEYTIDASSDRIYKEGYFGLGIWDGAAKFSKIRLEEEQESVEKKEQESLVFGNIGEKSFGDASFEVNVTGGSGTGAVTLQSSDPSILEIDGNTAVVKGAGTVTITATKAGDEEYNAKTETKELTIHKASIDSKYEEIKDYEYQGEEDENVSLNVKEQWVFLDELGECTYTLHVSGDDEIIENAQISETGILTYQIKRSKDEEQTAKIALTVTTKNYKDFPLNIVVSLPELDEQGNEEKKEQAFLVFENIGEKSFGDASFEINVTGGSGTGAVTLQSSNPSILEIDGNTAVVKGAGTVTITATKAGDDEYNAKTETKEIIIHKASIDSKYGEIKDYKHQGEEDENVSLNVKEQWVFLDELGECAYTLHVSGDDEIIENAQISETGILTYQIKRSKDEEQTAKIALTVTTKNYKDFPLNIVVSLPELDEQGNEEKKEQAFLVFENIGEKSFGDASFEINVTGGSGTGAVTLQSSDPSILEIDGNTAVVKGAGTVTITATKAGDEEYNAKTETKELTIHKASIDSKYGEIKDYKHQGKEDESVSFQVKNQWKFLDELEVSKYTLKVSGDKDIIQNAQVSETGILTYKIKRVKNEAQTAKIELMVSAKNYNDFTLNIIVSLPKKDEPQVTPTPEATSVKLNVKKNITMGKKEKLQLKASVKPAAASQKISWKSSKKNTVAVSKSGKITAKKVGTATITATTANGKKANCKVTVKQAPKKVTLAIKTKTLKKGKTYQIKPKLPSKTASYHYTYKSSKKSVAEVSKTGKVKAKKRGRATITVKTFNKKATKLKIVVK